MQNVKIAAAQVRAVKGDIEANVRRHVAFVNLAVEQAVDFVIFPELSLTGYEPSIAAEHTVDPHDGRVKVLQDIAREHGITIVVGAPVANPGCKPFIGEIVFMPDRTLIYRKKHLHGSEEEYFSPGDEYCVLNVGGVSFGLSICADLAHESHPAELADMGASIYASGVFVSEKGYPVDSAILKGYASKHAMAIVMSNYVGMTGGMGSAGKSAIWDEKGELVVVGGGEEELLVVGERVDGEWGGRVVGTELGEAT